MANISVHEPVSSSGKKLRVLQKPSTVASTDENQDLGYGLVDLNLLKQFIDMLSCEKCYGRLDTTVQALAGVAISLEVTCLDPTCKHKYTKAMSDTLHSSEGKLVRYSQRLQNLSHSRCLFTVVDIQDSEKGSVRTVLGWQWILSM